MTASLETLHEDLIARAAGYGIAVREADLDDDVPGEFDGPTIRLNRDYDAAERAFYLAHSIGSIAQWSLEPAATRRVFDELREAKLERKVHEDRLARAIAEYLSFEGRTWEYAVWLLEDIGRHDLVAAFTNFGRADMESMRVFHSTGKAPPWREFFAAWNDEVRRGERTVTPFVARSIPACQAIPIPKQEIVQEED